MSMNIEMTAPMGVVQARKNLGRLVRNAAVLHRPAVIANGEAVGLLVGADDIDGLAAGLRFSPEVYEDGEAVSVWLPELEVYGHGADVSAAMADLADEIREYIDEYLADVDRYRHSPNRTGHFLFVLKALALDAGGRLEQGLLGSDAIGR